MKEEQYYINNPLKKCIKIPSKYFLIENYLSELKTEKEKSQARKNLGITILLQELKNIIDNKVIESGGVPWDIIPTEGNTGHVLSSDVIYQTLQNYFTKEQIQENLIQLEEIFAQALEEVEENIREELTEHKNDTTVHVTQEEKDNWNSFTVDITQDKLARYLIDISKIDYIENEVKHLTTEELSLLFPDIKYFKDNYNKLLFFFNIEEGVFQPGTCNLDFINHYIIHSPGVKKDVILSFDLQELEGDIIASNITLFIGKANLNIQDIKNAGFVQAELFDDNYNSYF